MDDTKVVVEGGQPRPLVDDDDEYFVCRVCQCAEPDSDGERALQMLSIPSDPKVLLGRGQSSSPPPILWGADSVFHSSEVRPSSQYGHEISVMLLNLQASIIHLRRHALHIGRSSSSNSRPDPQESSPPLESIAVSVEPAPLPAAGPVSTETPNMSLDARADQRNMPLRSTSASPEEEAASGRRESGEEIGQAGADAAAGEVSVGLGGEERGEGLGSHAEADKEGRTGAQVAARKAEEELVVTSSRGECLGLLLMEIGCACKGGMALAHYACVLRWFVSRGNVRCEICGQLATGVRMDDVKTIMMAVQERRRSAAFGWEVFLHTEPPASTGPPVVGAAVGEPTASMRQKRVEAAAWFDPQFSEMSRRGSSRVIGSSVFGSASESLAEVLEPDTESLIVSPGVKLLLDALAVIIASALMALTLAKLFSSPMSPKMRSMGLQYILATLVSLGIVVWFRLVILPRIRRGPTRYWAVLLFFWFLIFGIWGLGAHVSGNQA